MKIENSIFKSSRRNKSDKSVHYRINPTNSSKPNLSTIRCLILNNHNFNFRRLFRMIIIFNWFKNSVLQPSFQKTTIIFKNYLTSWIWMMKIWIQKYGRFYLWFPETERHMNWLTNANKHQNGKIYWINKINTSYIITYKY